MPSKSSSSVRVFYPRYSREELIARLRERVRVLSEELPLVRAVLFGSWATGRATAFSDVDVLVVYSGPRREDAVRLVRRVIGLRGIEPHVYPADDAELLALTLGRMTSNGVDLLPVAKVPSD